MDPQNQPTPPTLPVTPPVEQRPPGISLRNALFVLGSLTLVSVFAVWIFSWRVSTEPKLEELQNLEASLKKPIKISGLGSEIYTKTSNPIQEDLLAAPAAVANPLENAYKNPFADL